MSRSSEPEIRPCSGLALVAGDERAERVGEAGAADLLEPAAELALAQLGHAERLVGGEARLLQRVGEGIVPDVVEQGGEPDRETVVGRHVLELAPFLQAREGAARQVVGAEGVLEPGVGGAGIDEEGVADLADVAQPLHRRRVQREERGAVEADVVPEGIADDFEVFGVGRHGMAESRSHPERSEGGMPRGMPPSLRSG